MRSHRLIAVFALLIGGLLVLQLSRWFVLMLSGPTGIPWSLLVVMTVLVPAIALAVLGIGAWKLLRTDAHATGLRYLVGGACIAMLSSPMQVSVLALGLAAWSAVELSRMSAPPVPTGMPATPGQSAPAPAPAADLPAIRRLFRLTLAAPFVLTAAVGAGVKIMLDRAGEPTLSWWQGVEYSMFIVLPLAVAFFAMAWLERRYLRGRLAAEPGWVKKIGVPCWIGALVGAIAGGVYALWPMMMNVEASIIAVLMPWWFAQWELAGAALVAAVVYAVARMATRRSL